MITLNTTQINSRLLQAAREAQAYYLEEQGIHYPIEGLLQSFFGWLEESVEQLADEAMFHCLEGDRSIAFNRDSFKRSVKKLEEVALPEEEDIAA